MESINQAFRNSITEFNYQGKYRGVFPIKVNQLREVVEEILDAGKPFDFGLEVGSKPELFAGLALQNQMGSLIICNGYKDCRVHQDGAARHRSWARRSSWWSRSWRSCARSSRSPSSWASSR